MERIGENRIREERIGSDNRGVRLDAGQVSDVINYIPLGRDGDTSWGVCELGMV